MDRFIIMTCTWTLAAGAASAVDSSDDTPPEPTETTMDCADGQIWEDARSGCVPASEAGLTDDMRYERARELAHGGRLDDALTLLAAAENPRDTRILSYIGYVHRKAGNLDLAMEYYRAALTIDPDNIMARSYMGQGMIEAGDLAGARAELIEIRNRGGRDSWAYIALKQALQGTSGY